MSVKLVIFMDYFNRRRFSIHQKLF